MAIKALVDPRRRLLQQKANVQNGGEINPPKKTNVIPQKGGVNQGSTATPGSKSFSVIPKRNIQGVPQTPAAPPPDKPDVYSPKPADLATVAEQMRVAREKGDFGTLNELTTKQYVPQLEKAQTSIANVNTAQVSRLLGDQQPIPTTLEEQRAELTTLAKQLQTARESGDLGTANQLAMRYQSLTKALQATATGQPVAGQPNTVTPTPASPEVKAQLDALVAKQKLAQQSGTDISATEKAFMQKLQAQMAGQPAITLASSPVGEGIDPTMATATGQPRVNLDKAPIGIDPAASKAQQTADFNAWLTKNPGKTWTDWQNEVNPAMAQPQGDPTLPSGAPVGKAATAQTATGAPEAATGGTPGSTVPSGETDASVQNPPPGGEPTGTYDAAQAYSGRLSNPGLMFKGPMGQMIPDPAGGQKIQSAIDYDNSILQSMPPEAQSWMSEKLKSEQATFEQAIAQYPDQWEKIFRDHQTRVNGIKNEYQSVGKYESMLDAKLAELPPETQVKIKALNEQQKNEFLQSAIADMQNGVDVLSKVDGYLAKYGEDPEFKLGEPGFEITDKTMDEFKPGEDPTVSGPDNVDLTTDKSRIDAALAQSSISEEGKKALGLQLETIQKRLEQGGGGFSEQELQNMAAPLLEQIEQEKQAAINSAKFELAAQGKATGGSYNATIQDITAKYANQKKEAVMALVRENMAYKQQGTSEAISALGGIAESERQAGLTEKGLALEGATTTTTLTSKEKEAQAQANFQQKALFQEGNLTVWGQKTQRDLDVYGMKLDQYQSDKGFDIDRLKIDLQEREIELGASVEQAKMKADKVARSIEEAGKEADRYDRRTTAIAELRQRMAAGDQDAGYRVQALEVQQELSEMGIKDEHSRWVANIIHQARAQGLELNQEMKIKIMEIMASQEAQEAADDSAWKQSIGELVGMGISFLI